MEQQIPREMLYTADEVFFAGTAVEITPLRSIDRITVGKGSRGPVTKRLQDEYFAIVSGEKARKRFLAVCLAFFFLLAGVGLASLATFRSRPQQVIEPGTAAMAGQAKSNDGGRVR